MFFHKNDNGDNNEGHAKRGKVVPLLPLRDIIVFPHMVVPLFVGREKSINALEEAMSHEKEILLAAQKKAKTNDPLPDDIFQMGTVGTIIQLLRLLLHSLLLRLDDLPLASLIQFLVMLGAVVINHQILIDRFAELADRAVVPHVVALPEHGDAGANQSRRDPVDRAVTALPLRRRR